MQTNDTIAAIATAPGKGGVGIVRVSGPLVPEIAEGLLGSLPQTRLATFTRFLDTQGQAIDFGLAIYFAAPASFTGEHVLELQGHGGPVVMDMLLSRVVEAGARLARPGEFSERAFLNNKIDLAEAEAIADLIDSASVKAAHLALNSLQGVFSRHINTLLDKLVALRSYVEAAMDFPEEEIDFLSDSRLQQDLQSLLDELGATLDSARHGSVIREGLTMVITGQPNVGKSTLLNALTGQETAIVTDIPGTTRDVLRSEISLDGLPLHVIDTAGIRESKNRIEVEGIKRTWQELSRCDLVIVMADAERGLDEEEIGLIGRLSPEVGLLVVYNKIDQTAHSPGVSDGQHGREIYISARHDQGLDLLRDEIKRLAGIVDAGEGNFMARHRHVDALEKTQQSVRNGMAQLMENRAGELLAAELQSAQQHLGSITGEYTTEDLLGNIFSQFCIGK